MACGTVFRVGRHRMDSACFYLQSLNAEILRLSLLEIVFITSLPPCLQSWKLVVVDLPFLAAQLLCKRRDNMYRSESYAVH